MAYLQMGVFNNNTGLGINEEELDDLQDQINTKFNISGGSITGEVDMTTNKIVNLGDATNPTDALNQQAGDARYVNVSGDTMTGVLDLTGGISLNSVAVTATSAEINILDGVTASTAQLNYNDITTLGTVEANKTVTADSSRNISNINVLGTQYLIATANGEIYPSSDFVFIGTEGTVGTSINFESSLIHSAGNYDYSITLKDDVTLAVRGNGGTEILNINDTNVNVKNDLVVTGDMYVNGSATYVNTTSLEVTDNLIMMGKDNTTTDITDLGWIAPYYDSGAGAVRYASLFRDASDGEFYIHDSIVGEPSTTITSGSLANFNCANIYVGTNINGVPASYYDPTSSIQNQLSDKISKTSGLTQDLALNDFNLTCSGTESSYLLTSGTGTVGLSGGNNGYCWIVSSNEVAGAVRISAVGGMGVNNTIQLQAGGGSPLKMEIGASEIDITNCNLDLNSGNITGVNNLSCVGATLTDDIDISKATAVSVNIQSDNSAYTKYGFGTVVETARFNVGGNSTSFIINDSATGLTGGNNALVFTPTGVSDTNLFLYANGTGSISLNANGSEKINVNSTEVDITNCNLDLNSNNVSAVGSLGISSGVGDHTLTNLSSGGLEILHITGQEGLRLDSDGGSLILEDSGGVIGTFATGGSTISTPITLPTAGLTTLANWRVIDLGGSGSFSEAGNIVYSCNNLYYDGYWRSYGGGVGFMTALSASTLDFFSSSNVAQDAIATLTYTTSISPSGIDLKNNNLDNAEITNPHICLERTTAQVVATATQTLLTWDSVLLNRGFSFTPTSGIVYVPEAGLYQVEWNIIKDANATGSQFIWVSTDSTAYNNTNKRFAYHVSSTNSDSYLNGSATMSLSTGSYVVVYVYQASGGNISYSTATAETRSVLMVTKIGKYVS